MTTDNKGSAQDGRDIDAREIGITKLASGRTVRQWEVCDPDRMMEMSDAAIRYALIDAKVDITSLASKIRKIDDMATEGMCHGLLADIKCTEIREVIHGHGNAARPAPEALPVPAPTHVDTTPMYKALIEARLALAAVNSGASIKALSLIDGVLNVAPEALSAAKGELSEAEILDVASDHVDRYGWINGNDALAFARAILAKAKGENA